MLLAFVAFIALLITYLADAERSVAMNVVIALALLEAVLATSLGVAMTPAKRAIG